MRRTLFLLIAVLFGTASLLAQSSGGNHGGSTGGGLPALPPIHLWQYDMVSGVTTNMPDQSGNGNAATLNGNFSRIAQGISFVGTPGNSGRMRIPTTGASTLRTVLIAYKANPISSDVQVLLTGSNGTFDNIGLQEDSGGITSWGTFCCGGFPSSQTTAVPAANSDTVMVITYGSPNRIYINGQEAPAYLVQASSYTPSGSPTGIDVADWAQAEGSHALTGIVEYVVGDTAVWTPAQVSSATTYVQQQIQSRGGSLTGVPVLPPIYYAAGDSITHCENFPCWTGITDKLIGGVGYTKAGISGQSASDFSFAKVIAPLASVNPLGIVDFWECTNDIRSGGVTGANCYTTITTLATAVHNAGLKFVPTTTLPGGTAGNLTDEQTLNSDIRNGYIAGTFDGIVDPAQDPICGQSLANIGTAQCSSDGIHPTAQFNNRIATYKAIAINAVLGKATSCPTFTIAAAAGTWTVQDNKSLSVQTLQLGTSAAATTQTFTFMHNQANWKISGIYFNTTTPFTATGLTSLTASIGDSAQTTTYYTAATSIWTGATYKDFGAIANGNGAQGGSDITFNLTGSQNLSTNPITGSTDVTICFNVR